MNRLARELTRNQKELEKAQGGLVFTWGGTDYACSATQSTAEQMLMVGGEQMHYMVTLSLRSDTLPTPGPKEKQTITFNGRLLRIDKVTVIHGGNITSLICQDVAQGA